MKKLTAFLMSILLVFTLVACGSQSDKNDTRDSLPPNEGTLSEKEQESDTEPTETPAEDPGTEPAETPSENSGAESTEVSAEDTDTEPEAGEGKTLVVYYSATGNTEEVANYIAAATNADVFELVPVEAYSSDDLNWTDDNSRVVYDG